MKTPHNRRVLVVEDDIYQLGVIETYFRNKQFQVDAVVNATSALDKLEQQRYDWVSLDVWLQSPSSTGKDDYETAIDVIDYFLKDQNVSFKPSVLALVTGAVGNPDMLKRMGLTPEQLLDRLLALGVRTFFIPKPNAREHLLAALKEKLDSEINGDNVFAPVRPGSHIWRLRFCGKDDITDSSGAGDGFLYIRLLLEKPRNLHTYQQLVDAVKRLDLKAARPSDFRRAGEPNPGFGGAAPEPFMDSTYITQTKARVREIEEELEEAKAFNDLGKQETLMEEREAIIDLLITAGVGAEDGPRGRIKRMKGDETRRSRRVRMNIDRALEIIGTHNIDLRQHLKNCIHRKGGCAYHPESDMNWRCHL